MKYFNTALKTVACVVALASGSNAMANTAADTFQWSGVVPAESVTGLYKIVAAPGSPAFGNGAVVFTLNANGDYDVSSNQISFQVVDAASSVSASTFDVKLDKLTFVQGGLVSGDATNVGLTAYYSDASGKSQLDNTPKASAGTVALELGGQIKKGMVKDGESIVVQAVILVSDIV